MNIVVWFLNMRVFDRVAYGMMHVILEVLRSCILQEPLRHIGHLGKTAACPKHWTIHANHLAITPKLAWPRHVCLNGPHSKISICTVSSFPII